MYIDEAVFVLIIIESTTINLEDKSMHLKLHDK